MRPLYQPPAVRPEPLVSSRVVITGVVGFLLCFPTLVALLVLLSELVDAMNGGSQ
jgi:hypothetical protein